jgi:hypothetical protein
MKLSRWFRCLLLATVALAVTFAPLPVAVAAVQYGVTINNARLDAIESTIGTSAFLQIYTGSKPPTARLRPPARC